MRGDLTSVTNQLITISFSPFRHRKCNKLFAVRVPSNYFKYTRVTALVHLGRKMEYFLIYNLQFEHVPLVNDTLQ